MLNEEAYDGYRIAYCPKCKSNFKAFFKKGEKYVYCPTCHMPINDFKKEINKKTDAAAEQKYSVRTKCFQY